MEKATVGIIGGTGLGDVLMKEAGTRTVAVGTPYGPPSGELVLADWEGVNVAFLSRHGPGHRLNPSSVPYRANIWALKELGVSAIIASGATGSLRDEFEPGNLVLCDQVIDKTHRRAGTFFDNRLVAHVEFADPFCLRLRELLATAGERIDASVHPVGTYVCMEGPQFSTRAESHMHRQWGGDLVGMTCMPEAKLAREAEMCYALVALPTDYDCWRPVDPCGTGLQPVKDTGSRPVPHGGDALLLEILGNLRRATENAISLIRETLKLMDSEPVSCRCQEALKLALWTDRSETDPALLERLGLLVGRYLSESDSASTE
ncbi:MAG: S-methyl-5'-thioadenosine phosphorylase [Planctomycetota bacterium]